MLWCEKFLCSFNNNLRGTYRFLLQIFINLFTDYYKPVQTNFYLPVSMEINCRFDE